MEDTLEAKIRYLEMIEAIIERMANNCFQLKGWAITLVAIIGSISVKDADKRFIIVAIIPVVGFFFLDGYYLQQERRYKLLYKNVSLMKKKEIDFNLDASKATGNAKEMEQLCYCKCLFSKSVICFYGLLFATIILLLIVLYYFK